MRRRVIRDLGTIAGVIVILATIVLVNDFFGRDDLAKKMTEMRQTVEKGQMERGNQVLSWDLLRQTKGTRKTGPTFAAELLENKDKRVNLVGFMTPLYEFREVTEFLFLPMPIECYFCASPPMRDVVLVQMAENTKVDILQEPVVIDGTLTLNEGAGTKFFYVLKDAGNSLNKKPGISKKSFFSQAHMEEAKAAQKAEEEAQEPLLEPSAPPVTGAAPNSN